jgi:glycosyltransferase involved in cell wall biosynthesis
MSLPKTLFLSRGSNAVAWYRCALPALALDTDWICYDSAEPPATKLVWGRTQRPLALADVADNYEVVVLQQPRGVAWLKQIREWQARGIVVLYEIDDWVRGIRKKDDHDFAAKFDRKVVEDMELCMRAADAMLVSTEWLADRYRSLNPTTFVCRNGLDLKRYALTRPQRDYVTIGWAGATGHANSMRPWLDQVANVLRRRPDTRFVSIGQKFADQLAVEFGPERSLSIPWAPFDTYPAAMTLMDIALAPAGQDNFYRGKSDLRWLEAGALGIPLVADPHVYPEIEPGVTGFHVASPAEVTEQLIKLVDDRELRERVGAAAKAHIVANRSAQVAAQRWAEVLREVAPAPAVAA